MGPEPHYLLRGEGKTSLCPRSRSLQGHSIHAKIHTRNASLQTSEPAGPHNRTAAPTARTLRQKRGGAQLPLASGGGGLSIQFKLSFKLILEEIYTAYRLKAFPSSQRTGGQGDGNEELLTLLRRQKREASPGGQRGTRTEMQRGRMTIVRGASSLCCASTCSRLLRKIVLWGPNFPSFVSAQRRVGR